MGSIKQTIKTTKKKKVRKSQAVAKKDKKGKAHCSNCGAYISK